MIAFGGATNLWAFRRHVEEGGAVTITAEMLDIKHPPADYNPNAPGGEDNHGYDIDLTAPAQLTIHTGKGLPGGIKLTAGYYRGHIYNVRGSSLPFEETRAKDTNYISIFSNANRSNLIAAVDHGPIYTSTNFGMTWTAITTPGRYEFPLCVASGGSGLFAQAAIATTNVLVANWYAVALSADGSKLVATAGTSQPSPTLNIRYSNGGVNIVWPAEFTGFVLEHSTGLNGEMWITVTNSAKVVGGENRVTVPSVIGKDFFRLRRLQ